jgi:hypothetical protein
MLAGQSHAILWKHGMLLEIRANRAFNPLATASLRSWGVNYSTFKTAGAVPRLRTTKVTTHRCGNHHASGQSRNKPVAPNHLV